jgi:PAS domain-containing protein
VLHRLRRLATVMLSLAAGDIAIEVPFRGERDEVGRLADVLQVFRDQAGRVMESEANLHAALESMVEAIVISSADMQVVMHNQRLVTMFDLPRRDYVGMRTNELADGRLEMDTNVVERAMRPVTITRKNSLFAGSHAGARRWAIANTLIQSCKLNGVEPLAYLTDVLQRIISGRTKNDELHALLPWNWHPPATFTGV